MEKVKLGSLWHVSRLTISAAGITSLWGETPKEEGWATLTEALASGIDHIDTAPAYRNGEAEDFLGEYFAEGWPADIRVTTKVGLGTVSPDDVRSNLRESIVRSLQRMNRRDVDLFLLHSHLVPMSGTTLTIPHARLKALLLCRCFRALLFPLCVIW